MGISAFRHFLLELLRKHAHRWVQEVLPEESLEFSLLDRSISFQRLNLQTHFLENFGLKLPLLVDTARLEHVVVTAVDIHVLRVEVAHLILHGKVLPQDRWLDEIEAAREREESLKALRLQRHEAAATGSGDQQSSPGSLFQAPGLELDVSSAELVVQDWSSGSDSPFALAATSSRLSLGTPFTLDNVVHAKEQYVTHLDLRFETYQMFCSSIVPGPLEQYMSVTDESNRVLGPCDELQLDLRISSAAEMSDKEHMPPAPPTPDGMGHEVSGEESLPMVSLAIRTDGSIHGNKLSFTQRQLANVIRHGRMWGMWFMCVQTSRGFCPPEEACEAYRAGWLDRCLQLVTAESAELVLPDPDIAAFEAEWPYREVLRQRTLALMGCLCEKIGCLGCEKAVKNAPRERSGKTGLWPRDPAHATNFLLDVDVSNSIVELRMDTEILSAPSSIRSEPSRAENNDAINGSSSCCLRFVPIEGTDSSVRYLLHVDNTFNAWPISNEVFLSNSRAEFVDRRESTPLLLIDKSYLFFDIVEQSDALLCPEQPPRRVHKHLGNLRGNLALSRFSDALNLLSDMLDLARIEDNPWDAAPEELKAHCDEVARFAADVEMPSRCKKLADTRLASSAPVAFLAGPEDHKKDVAVMQMKLSCSTSKMVHSWPLMLGHHVLANPAWLGAEAPGDDTEGADHVLNLAGSQLAVWRPHALPEEPLPAAGSAFWLPDGSHAQIACAQEVRCDMIRCDTNLWNMSVDASAIVVNLSVRDVALLMSIVESSPASTPSKGEFDNAGQPMLTSQGSRLSSSDCQSIITHQGSILTSQGSQLSSLESPSMGPSLRTPSASMLLEDADIQTQPSSKVVTQRSYPLLSLGENQSDAPDEEVQGLTEPEPEPDVVRGRICIEKLTVHLRESTSGASLLEANLSGQKLDARLPWGSSAVDSMEYSVRHFWIRDPRLDRHLLYCGEKPSAPGWRIPKYQRSGRQRAITLNYQAEVEEPGAELGAPWPSESHLTVQPLWICAQWDSIHHTCKRLSAEIKEEFTPGSSGRPENMEANNEHKGDVDADASVSSAQVFFVALRSWRLRLTLQQVVVLLPCDKANSLQICAGLNFISVGSQLRLWLSGMSVAIRASPKNSEFGYEVHVDEKAVLRPARMRFYTEQADVKDENDVLSLEAELIAEPLQFSFYTRHVVVITALVSAVSNLMTDLEGMFAPTRQPELDKAALEGRHAASKQALSAVLRVSLEAVHIGLVDSAIGIEICTMLLEDSSLILRTQNDHGGRERQVTPSVSEIRGDSSRSVISRSNSGLITERSESGDTGMITSATTRVAGESTFVPVLVPSHTMLSLEQAPAPTHAWPVGIEAHIRAFSVNLCPARTSRPFPFLEPVRIHVQRVGSGNANCSVSWLNLNLSSAVVDVLARLVLCVSQDQTQERITDHSPESETPDLEIHLDEEMLGSREELQPRADRTPPDANEKGWHCLNDKEGSSFVWVSNPHGPPLNVHSHLQWKIQLRSTGREQEGFELQNLTLKMDEHTSEANLRPTQRVQVLNFGKEKQSTLEALDRVMKRPINSLARAASKATLSLAGQSWSGGVLGSHILALQETSACGRYQEIHLSSVVFIENRCNVDLVIVPVCLHCASAASTCAEPHQEPMVLKASSKPTSVPLGWFALCTCGFFHPEIYCGLAERWFEAPTMETRRKLVDQGRLRPLVHPVTWKEINRYHSNVAGDYFLSSSSLLLPNEDAQRAKATHICANVYGISQDLDAVHAALIFSIALEPLVQFCNRLCCPLKLSCIGQMLEPGEDASILEPVGADLKAEIETPTGTLEHKGYLPPGKVTRTTKSSIYFRERPRSTPEREAASPPQRPPSNVPVNLETLEAILVREPGLDVTHSWSSFEVYPYKPESYRIIIYTRYWVVNRRSDCNIFIPHGHSVSYARDRNNKLLQVPKNSLRMLPEQALVRGCIRLGLYDQRDQDYSSSERTPTVPVTETFNVSQPTEGCVRIPITKRNAKRHSKSFGYTVQAESGPFYRTLIIKLVRRYTLVNHKTSCLVVCEKGAELPPFRLEAGQVRFFDPQGSSFQLAITGWSTSRKDEEMKDLKPEQFSAYFDISMEQKQSRFHLHHRHHGHHRCSEKSDRDLMMYESAEEDAEEAKEAKADHGIMAFVSEAHPDKHHYSITAVDMVLDGGAVIVSFSEAVRPTFRVLNRTGHLLHLRQAVPQDAVRSGKLPGFIRKEARRKWDGTRPPILELKHAERAEDILEFAWFNPWTDPRVEIWKQQPSYDDSKSPLILKQQFDIEQVQKHPQKLKVPREFCTPEVKFVEEFVVQTKVNNGCREVHIRPWCRVVNKRNKNMFIQTGEWAKGEIAFKACFIELSEGEHVCLQPMEHLLPGSRSETLPLNISNDSDIELTNQSSMILLKARHAGQRGYVRHRNKHANDEDDNVDDTHDFTEVVVHKDPMSDFLIVDLCQVEHAPWLVENRSRSACTITMAGNDADVTLSPGTVFPHGLHIPAGKVRRFIPHSPEPNCNTCQVNIAASPHGVSDVIDLERLARQAAGSKAGHVISDALVVHIYPGRPRRIVLKDYRPRPKIQHTRGDTRRKLPGSGGRTAFKFVRKHVLHHVMPLSSIAHALPRTANAKYHRNLGKVTEAARRLSHLPGGKKAPLGSMMRGSLRPLTPLKPLRSGFHTLKHPLKHIKPMKTVNMIGNLIRSSTSISNESSRPLSQDGFLEAMSPSSAMSRFATSSQKFSYNLSEASNPFQLTQEAGERLDVRFEGAGVNLLDSMMLKEIGYVSVAGVHGYFVDVAENTQVKVKIDSIQVDVRDRSNKISLGRVVLLPWVGSNAWRKNSTRKRQPLINFLARWRCDGDLTSRGEGHYDVQELQLKVLPIEVRMDTEHLFVVAEWVQQLQRSLLVLQRGPADQDSAQGVFARSQTSLLSFKEGAKEDPIVGEPRWKERSEKEDFKAPTPLFVKKLEIRKIEVVLSWRFSGRARKHQNWHPELQRWHYILKKALPFDLSQASISVGRHRTFGVGKHRVVDIGQKDTFHRNGFADLTQALLDEYKTAILFQTHRLVGSQNLFLNTPRLFMDVRNSLRLAIAACVRMKPNLLLAAVFLMAAAFVQSLEDFFTTLAKMLCQAGLDRTPYGLRREPSGLSGIVLDALAYSFPWHLMHLISEWQRLMRHARSSPSWCFMGSCPLVALWRLFFALISSVLVILAKFLQFFHYLFRLLAWRLAGNSSPTTPTFLRAGPQQHYMGAPTQFAFHAAVALSLVGFYGSGQGRRALLRRSTIAGMHAHGRWMLIPLPDAQGLLLAVADRGFFLVRETVRDSSVGTGQEDEFYSENFKVVWQATGFDWKPPALLILKDSRGELPLIRLQHNFRRKNKRSHEHHVAEPRLLKLGSLPAVMTAYGFIRDFIAAEPE